MSYAYYIRKNGLADSEESYYSFLLHYNIHFPAMTEQIRKQFVDACYKFRFTDLGGRF